MKLNDINTIATFAGYSGNIMADIADAQRESHERKVCEEESRFENTSIPCSKCGKRKFPEELFRNAGVCDQCTKPEAK